MAGARRRRETVPMFHTEIDMGLTSTSGLRRRDLLAWLGAASVLPPAAAAAKHDAPALLLAREADPAIDPAGYLVSEKFDGVQRRPCDVVISRSFRSRTNLVREPP